MLSLALSGSSSKNSMVVTSAPSFPSLVNHFPHLQWIILAIYSEIGQLASSVVHMYFIIDTTYRDSAHSQASDWAGGAQLQMQAYPRQWATVLAPRHLILLPGQRAARRRRPTQTVRVLGLPCVVVILTSLSCLSRARPELVEGLVEGSLPKELKGTQRRTDPKGLRNLQAWRGFATGRGDYGTQK